MTKIAALSVHTPNRPATAIAAAPGVRAASRLDKTASAPMAIPVPSAAPALSIQNTKAPVRPAVSSTLMGALIGVQAIAPETQQVLQSVVQTITDHSTSPAPAQKGTPTSQGHGAGPSSPQQGGHGACSEHDAHDDDGRGGDHTDRGWHGRPPAPTPSPAPDPAPQPVVIPSFDPSLPARAIAEAAKTLAEGRAAEAARTAFVTAAAERRAEAFAAQGKAALAVFKGMQAQHAAWQDQQASLTGAYLKALYA